MTSGPGSPAAETSSRWRSSSSLRVFRGRHEVDALWRGAALVVQLDGFAYHRTRRDRERDAATDADLELAGYRVLRLTWDDVTARSASTARRLRRLLASRHYDAAMNVRADELGGPGRES